ncbi:hypothetical protein J6590_065396 [Homalodisca vitripennis]|nr:hypothetical protein J6590_065396 [Homalodisca vitripennis]
MECRGSGEGEAAIKAMGRRGAVTEVILGSGDQRLKGDFQTTTNGRAGGLLARPGSLSGHLSMQQPRLTLLDPVN